MRGEGEARKKKIHMLTISSRPNQNIIIQHIGMWVANNVNRGGGGRRDGRTNGMGVRGGRRSILKCSA